MGGWNQTIEAAQLPGMPALPKPHVWPSENLLGFTEHLRKDFERNAPGVLWVHWPEDKRDDSDSNIVAKKAFWTTIIELGTQQVQDGRTLMVEIQSRAWREVYDTCLKIGRVTENVTDKAIQLRIKKLETGPQDVLVTEKDIPQPSFSAASGAKGIHFGKGVKPDVARLLRRLHQNLGHPAAEDLARHLRVSGASAEIVKAAKLRDLQKVQGSEERPSRHGARHSSLGMWSELTCCTPTTWLDASISSCR